MLPLFQRVGDELGKANCLASLGDIALRREDHLEAGHRYAEALPLYRRVGNVLGEANCIKNIGDIAERGADHAGARVRYQEAQLLYLRLGDAVGEATCIACLGRVAAATGDKETARSQGHTALAMLGPVHATRHITIVHEDLAAVTTGSERAAHVAAAKAGWREMGLEDQAARLERRFG